MSPMPEVGQAPGTNCPGRWMLQRALLTMIWQTLLIEDILKRVN